MNLSAIFDKPIDRTIEGVIKADDDASLHLEVEEYILTNEVEKRLEQFLAAYTHYDGANGVWISGFFGSGKSHLLKIQSLLLENATIDGERVLDMFLPKCEHNEILRADLQRAVAIPSQSILFNIDQKADVISKSQFDALLAVFVKVFDEMCGYYGKQGHIAQFERDLDSRGQYAAFQEAYEDVAGQAWTFGREQALLESDNIAAAYAQATGAPKESARGILDKYRAEYKVSIEDFAEQVWAYVQRQGDDFRLNFFVDEVGQYIADNIKLMTNLQTLAESLATKCRGRAWLIVTAEEEMNTVVGEMKQQQGNDFSKIQARFKNRMKLTSADVEEVIRKRLLTKNEQGIELLADVYAAEQNNFRTLFDFADGAQTYRNYRDRDHFIHSYPFIPYQFPLFQAAIQNLSQHSAFEGKHSSVGERSMLAVFQQVALQIADHQVGQLATFDLMFEGIRTALKSQIQHGISTAERHLEDPFAVQVLKALFLVKYVKEFKATVRNVTVLMLDRFDKDLPALRRRVEEALNKLEQQTYIQRNGEEYQYLTDEEKDVEQEIKNTEVDTVAVADQLATLVFDTVLKTRKIRYDENGQDYSFSRKLDDRLQGREYEVGIHVISPFHQHAENETVLRSQSMGRDELMVLMPANERLVRDLGMYKRTEKYIQQNVSITQQDSIKRILTDKQFQNQERLLGIRKLVERLLGKAKLIVDGQELDVGSTDPQTRMVQGFHDLLVRTYPNLRMLRGVTYTENDIAGCLQQANTLFGNDGATFSEAEQEMLATIQANQRNGLRTTMQTLDNHFERKPYGWYLAAVQCTLAKLWTRGKVEARRDSTLLEASDLEKALRNTQAYGNLVLEPQTEFTANQVRRLRDFHADFFNGPPGAHEAKTLGQETGSAFQGLDEELAQLRRQAERYPFLISLDHPLSLLKQVTDKPYNFYLTELNKYEDELFDAKETVIEPIRRFMAGSQRDIYGAAQQLLANQEPNLAYVEGDEAAQVQAKLADPHCYRGNGMQHMKMLVDSLHAKVATTVKEAQERAIQVIDERWSVLSATSEYAELSPDKQAQLQAPFEALKDTVRKQTLVAVIRDKVQQFEHREYPRQLEQMARWTTPVPKPGKTVYPKPGGGGQGIKDPSLQYVFINELKTGYEKPWMADEADVEEYVQALKKKMLQAIRDGKRIHTT